MKLKSYHIAMILIIFIFGGIFLSDSLGYWNKGGLGNNKKITNKEDKDTVTENFSYKDIKGSSTFLEISSSFNIPLEDLKKAFNLKGNVENFKCKDIKEIYTSEEKEVGVGSIRMFVSLYKGMDYELEEEVYLPITAVNILKEKGNINDKWERYLESHEVAPK